MDRMIQPPLVNSSYSFILLINAVYVSVMYARVPCLCFGFLRFLKSHSIFEHLLSFFLQGTILEWSPITVLNRGICKRYPYRWYDHVAMSMIWPCSRIGGPKSRYVISQYFENLWHHWLKNNFTWTYIIFCKNIHINVHLQSDYWDLKFFLSH